MMRRQVSFLIAPLSLVVICILLVLILATLVVEPLKRGQPATVHFKPGVVAGDSREGVVAKRDRYITIKSDAGDEVFTWDQIRYISEKGAPDVNQVERIVDLIDLLSKLGIAATVLFFAVGLIQYRQGQVWEREKFLAAAIKEFIERNQNRNAMAMIDSLALYPKGRVIALFPDEEKAKDKRVFVTNDEVIAALTTDPGKDLNENDFRAIAIRECFDSFLSYISTFRHYVEQKLITRDALSAHIGYWFILFGPKSSFPDEYKQRIFKYARKYEMTDFEDLVNEYSGQSRGEDREAAEK